MTTLETTLDAIRTKVDTDLPALVTVYDSDVWNDDTVLVTNGVVKPFVVFYAGSSETTKDRRARGIVSPTLDPVPYDVMFEAVAPTPAIARTIFGQIRTILVGYAPTGSSMLKLDSVRGYDIAENETRPVTYGMAGLFVGIANL